MPATSTDKFLGGRIIAQQPKQGFRSGHDAVLLAASLAPSKPHHICEFGTGAGVAALCLLARHPDCQLTGFDINPDMIALARANAAQNGLADNFIAIEGDITAPLAQLALPSVQQFDAVLANPPYFDEARIQPLPNASKQQAFAAPAQALSLWVRRACALVKARGVVSFIYRADGLAHLLAAIDGRLGGLLIQPIASKASQPATRIIVRGPARQPRRTGYFAATYFAKTRWQTKRGGRGHIARWGCACFCTHWRVISLNKADIRCRYSVQGLL